MLWSKSEEEVIDDMQEWVAAEDIEEVTRESCTAFLKAFASVTLEGTHDRRHVEALLNWWTGRFKSEDILDVVKGSAISTGGKDKTRDLLAAFLEDNELNGVYEFQRDRYVRFAYPDGTGISLVFPRSSQFKKYLTQLHLRTFGKTITERMLRKAIINIDGMDATRIKLHSRNAERDGHFWFDLSNEEGEVVKISNVGWTVLVPELPVFITNVNNLPAFRPVRTVDFMEYFNQLWKHVNYDKKYLLLHKIAFLFSFLPRSPQPIAIVHGEHGSAKSYFTKVWKRFVDPSKGDNHTMAEGKDLTHILGHSWFVPFDNVSGIKQAQSDVLCQASTGGTMANRKLYTDGETYNQDLKSVVVLNGINVSANQPDLLRRCIMFQFRHIRASERRSEEELKQSLDLVGARIQGAIMSILSRSMGLVAKYRKMKNLPVMADFTIWGCALAEAINEDVDEFLEVYADNRVLQTLKVSENDELGTILLKVLGDLPFRDIQLMTKEWLLRMIIQRGEEISTSLVRDKYFPKTTLALSRKLERLRPTLRELGYTFTEERRNYEGKRQRVWVWKKNKSNLVNGEV